MSVQIGADGKQTSPTDWSILNAAIERVTSTGLDVEVYDETYSMAASCQTRWSRVTTWFEVRRPNCSDESSRIKYGDTDHDLELVEWLVSHIDPERGS